MKTLKMDFSIVCLSERVKANEVMEIIDSRQAQFTSTVKYNKNLDELKKIIDSLGLSKQQAGKLDEAITALECTVFEGGYTAGIGDLMVAMTFNATQFTATEYIEDSMSE